MQALIVQQLRWQDLVHSYSQERGGHRQVDYQNQHSTDENNIEISDRSSEEEIDIIMLKLPRASLFPKEPEEEPRSVSEPTTRQLLYVDDPPNYSDLLMGNTDGPNRDGHHQSPVSIGMITVHRLWWSNMQSREMVDDTSLSLSLPSLNLQWSFSGTDSTAFDQLRSWPTHGTR